MAKNQVAQNCTNFSIGRDTQTQAKAIIEAIYDSLRTKAPLSERDKDEKLFLLDHEGILRCPSVVLVNDMSWLN